MADYEYRVQAVDDFGTTEGVPIAAAVEAGINAYSRKGWEFLRIETVTVGSPNQIWADRKSIMVFRRAKPAAIEAETKPTEKPLVLTQPVFVDAVTDSEIEIPTEQPDETPFARPSIERAARSLRGSYPTGMPANKESFAPSPVQRTSGERLAWHSGQHHH